MYCFSKKQQHSSYWFNNCNLSYLLNQTQWKLHFCFKKTGCFTEVDSRSFSCSELMKSELPDMCGLMYQDTWKCCVWLIDIYSDSLIVLTLIYDHWAIMLLKRIKDQWSLKYDLEVLLYRKIAARKVQILFKMFIHIH